VWEPAGCPACAGTGFSGRIGVFEMLRVDDAVRRLIHGDADEARIAEHAFADSPNLLRSVRVLVKDGATSPAEAARILRREEA